MKLEPFIDKDLFIKRNNTGTLITFIATERLSFNTYKNKICISHSTDIESIFPDNLSQYKNDFLIKFQLIDPREAQSLM